MEPLISASALSESAGLLALSPPGWGGALLYGLLNSIVIAVGAFGFGLVLGTGGAYGKLYGGPVIRDLMAAYTTIARAVPDLVLILALNFAGVDLLNQVMLARGYDRIEVNGLVLGIFVLGIVQGAYSTEVIRGAILAVPPGQIEAARAYGMSPLLIMRRVTLPLMLSNAIPGMANLWLVATKDTALLALVSVKELTLMTQQAAATTKAYFTFFMAAGLLYLLISLVSERFFAGLEKRARRGQPDLRSGL